MYEFVIEDRSVEYAADKVIEYSDKAKNSLSDFKESNVKNSLVEFADFVSKREY